MSVAPKAALIALIVAVPIAVAGWLQGCGPSVQSVYEGNVRFEHCYRLDLDPNIAAGHREACWRSYIARYHYGQTKDRIEYANRRVRALAAGDVARPTLQLDAGDDAESFSPAEAPAPTSMHAPPPPTAKRAPGPSDAGIDAADAAPPDASLTTHAARELPGSPCADKCAAQWDKCGGPPCRSDAGAPAGTKVARACTLCERDYRRCMQRCFR